MRDRVLASSSGSPVAHVASRVAVADQPGEPDSAEGFGYRSDCLNSPEPSGCLPDVPTDSELEKGRMVRPACSDCCGGYRFRRIRGSRVRWSAPGGGEDGTMLDSTVFENVPDGYSGRVVVVRLPEGGNPPSDSYDWKSALEKEAHNG